MPAAFPLGAATAGPAVAGGYGLVAFFLVGLLGGAHCMGMCGPLVTLYADRMETPTRRDRVRQHGLFNAGRTVSYTVVGALAGAAGALFFDAAALATVGDATRAAVGLVVGVAILVVGVGYLGRGSRGPPHVSVPYLGSALGAASSAITARVDRWADGPTIAALGALHGFLPCPMLYPAYLYAFAVGDPLVGAASLFVLGIGTFPTLFAYGTAIGSMDADTRGRLHRALGAAFLLLGTIPVLNALAVLGVPVPKPPLPMPTLGG